MPSIVVTNILNFLHLLHVLDLLPTDDINLIELSTSSFLIAPLKYTHDHITLNPVNLDCENFPISIRKLLFAASKSTFEFAITAFTAI
jgi:hypothetical protein